MKLLWSTLLLAWPLASGCGDPTAAPGPVDPPAASLLAGVDQAGLLTVRRCRSSVEHPFTHVVVKVDAQLALRYDRGPFPFPEGALVVKEEFADAGCHTPIGTTLMRKEPTGYWPAFGDWRWQRLDPAGKVIEDGKIATCASCHSVPTCRTRDFVCSEPDAP